MIVGWTTAHYITGKQLSRYATSSQEIITIWSLRNLIEINYMIFLLLFFFFLSFLQVFLSSIHHLWISYIFTRIIICGYTCGFSKIDFNRNFKNVFTWGYVKFQTLSTQSNSLPRFITIGLSMFLSGMQMKPFIPLTAQELVFGYDDPLVSIAHRFFPISRRPMSKMGILNGVSYYNTFIFILYL